jgi:hypothetical protein
MRQPNKRRRFYLDCDGWFGDRWAMTAGPVPSQHRGLRKHAQAGAAVLK